MDIKTFIKILKITALVVSVACVLFVLYIFVILNLFFSSDTPEGCDPSMPTSACDYIDEKFEKELQNLPPVAALPSLDKRPVFWLGEKKFAGGAKFDYLYIKDDFGVCLGMGAAIATTFCYKKICQSATMDMDTTRSIVRRTKGG